MKGIFERKRILSLLLSAAMLMTMMPGFNIAPFAADDAVTVNVANLGIPVFNIATHKNSGVKGEYLSNELNAGYLFKLETWNNVNATKKNDLKSAYSIIFQKVSKKKWWSASYRMDKQSLTDTFRNLIASGEISYELQGQLRSDKHNSLTIPIHLGKKTDRGTLTLYEGNTSRIYHVNASTDKTYTWYPYGNNVWVKANLADSYCVALDHTTCKCGGAGVKNVTVAFADLVAPKIKSVTTTADKQYYNSGSFDIVITFSENIRFADAGTTGKVADADNELVLNAFDRQTGQQINGVTAKLISLDGNVLTYRYTVPEDDTTDIIIKGVADASRQTMFSSGRNLYVYTQNGYKHLSLIQDIYAPFCDLAGNPIDTAWQPVNFSSGDIYVDKVAPKYSHTEIFGSMMKESAITTSPDEWPADIDRSQVFAGVGDTLTFSAYFNEELSCKNSDNVSNIKATLNIKDANGEYVVLSAQKAQTVPTSVNSYVPVTCFTFEPLVIEKGMLPENDARGITIVDIDIDGLTDLCSNQFESELSELPAAKQQEWLDTISPEIKTTYFPDQITGKYTPNATENGFYFPVQIAEQPYPDGTVGNDNLYMSGTNAVGDGYQAQESGEFVLSNNSEPSSDMEFEWCVTMSPDLTGEEEWKAGVLNGHYKFTQIENGNYIHIRFPENANKPILDPVLSIYGYDYAGNCGENTEFPLDFPVYESVNPVVNAVFGSVSEENSKKMTAHISAKDTGVLTEVKYKYVVNATSEDSDASAPTSADEISDEWKQVDLNNSTAEAGLENALESQKNNFVYVCVSATDRSGNTTEELFAYNVDLRLPSFDVNIPSGYVGDTESVYIGKLNTDEAAELGWRWEVNSDSGEVYKSYGSLIAIVKAGDQIAAKFIDDLTDEAPQDAASENKPVSKISSDADMDSFLESIISDGDGFVQIDENGNTAFVGAMVYDEYGINLETGELISTADGTARFSVLDIMEGTNKASELIDFTDYYGEMEIYTVLIDAKEYSTDGSIVIKQASEEAAGASEGGNAIKPVSVQKYVLRAAPDDKSDNDINIATFGQPRMPNGEKLKDDDYRFDPEARFSEVTELYDNVTDENGDYIEEEYENGLRYKRDYKATRFSTLSGIQLPIALKNNRVEGWGVEDIDFEESYLEVYADSEDNVVFTQPLTADTAAQTLIFPDDIVYETGNYYVKVYLVAKASGRVDEFTYEKCFCVLNYEPEEFGDILVAKTKDYDFIKVDNTENGAPITQVYHHIPDEPYYFGGNTTFHYYSKNAGNPDLMHVFMWVKGDRRDRRVRFQHLLDENWNYIENSEYMEIEITSSDIDFFENYPLINVPDIYSEDKQPVTQTLMYQELYANGKTSPVKQLDVIFTPPVFPEISCSVVPDGLTDSLQIRVDDITFPYGEMEKLFVAVDFADTYNIFYDDGRRNLSNTIDFEAMKLTDEIDDNHYEYIEYDIYLAKIMPDNTLAIDFRDGEGYRNVLDTEELAGHTYSLFAIDSTGGVGHSDPIVVNEYFDNAPPEVLASELSANDGAYEVTLTLTDHPLALGENMRLYISDEDPSLADDEVLDDESTSEEIASSNDVLLRWSELEDNSFGSFPNSAGIYSMTVISQNEKKNEITVKIEGSVPRSEALYVYAIDELGHESTPINLFDGLNVNPIEEPKITDIARADDGSLKLTFNEAVFVTEPAGEELLNNVYISKEVSGIPIYSDGKYTVRYEDIFGNQYAAQIEVALDGDFSLNTEISPTTATNGNVTLDMKSARSDDLLKITDVSVVSADGTALSEGTDYESTLADDKQSLKVVMKVNGTVTVSLSYGTEAQQRSFVINNIDRETHADIMWEYAAGEPAEGATETPDSVTAICYSTDESEELTGTNGMLSYTFETGNTGDSYTFEFTDEAGNTGTVTAALPVSINRPVSPRLTDFDMQVSGVVNSKTYVFDEYSYFADEEASENEAFDFSELSPAQSDILTFNTGVDAKILVLPAGTTAESVTNDTVSADINGVTLSGKKITITENAEFTVALLEAEAVASAAGDTTQKVIIIPVKIENIQKIENVELVYAVLSRFKRRVYFEPNGQNLTITNTEGIALETEHEQYKNYYYHDFTENGQFIFYFKDEVGNTGSITATVNDIIDMNVGTSDGIRWWPYKYNPENDKDQSVLTQDKVNYNVTAQLKFNMNISEASLYYIAESGGPDYDKPVPADIASLNVTLDLVDITYKENTDATILVVKGENQTEIYQQIQKIEIIDKKLPVISHNYVADESTPRRSVTVSFTADEDVLYTERSTDYTNGPINVTITENGKYTYSFTDRAANTTVVTLNVTDIDTTPATVSYKLTETGTEYATWQELREDNDVSDISEVYVKADEEISYTFQNLVSGTAEANAWFKLDIVKNGYYPLHIWDKAENLTVTGLSGIILPDTIAPSLWISGLRVSVAQGADDATLTEVLKQGVTFSDNESKTEEIELTWDLTALDINTPGEYNIIYTAKDKAGNEAKAERYVKVIGENDVTLTVNGKDTSYMGTLIVNTGILEFEVGNLANSDGTYEPYSMYIKKGYKTAGQMKNDSTKVTDNKITVSDSGIYTVYIMTQSRTQYITYLYIEQ